MFCSTHPKIEMVRKPVVQKHKARMYECPVCRRAWEVQQKLKALGLKKSHG